MKNYIYIITLLLLFSCKNNNNNLESTIPIKKISVNINSELKNLPLSKIFKSAKILSLETTDDCLLAEISSLQIYKDKIYILDNETESIYKFNNKGKYINKINNIGQGPQEYTHIENFDIDTLADKLILFCDNKIQYYNTNNNKLFKEIENNYFGIQKKYIEDNIYANYAGNMKTDQVKYNLQFIKDNHITNEFFQITPEVSGYNLSQNNNFGMKNNKQNSWFTTPFQDTVYQIYKDNIKQKIAIDFSSKKIPDNFFKSHNKKEFTDILFSENYCFLVESFYLSKNNDLTYFNFRQGNKIMSFLSNNKDYYVTNNFLNDINGIPINPATFLYGNEDEKYLVNYCDISFIYPMIEYLKRKPTETGNKLLRLIPKELYQLENKQEDNPILIFLYY